MNEIEEFHNLTYAIIERLNLPIHVQHDDDEKSDEAFVNLELAIGFPNLTEAERELIAALHIGARALTLMLNTPTSGLTDEEKCRHEDATRKLEHEAYPHAREMLEVSGLRAKLSDFQERLLDDFAKVHFKAAESASS